MLSLYPDAEVQSTNDGPVSFPSPPPKPRPALPSAEDLWSLAPLIVGRPVVRLADRTGAFRAACERPLGVGVPVVPAAGMIVDAQGLVRTVCLDVDSKGGLGGMRRDLAGLRSVLCRAGLDWVEDFSPSGGHHLYVPVQAPVSQLRVRVLVEALAGRFPSLDPSPHQNGVHGCIRLPGAVHRMGGRQLLVTAFERAQQILRRRNPVSALERLEQLLKLQGAPVAVSTGGGPVKQPVASGVVPGGALTELGRAVAVHGQVPAGYRSASEARMAALCSLAACGWSEGQVWSAMSSELVGLSGLYARYSHPETIQRRFCSEWSKATSWVFSSSEKPSQNRLQSQFPKSDMNVLNSQGGQGSSGSGGVRKIKMALGLLDRRLAGSGRSSLAMRMMLRSLVTYATMTDSLEVAVGCRAHALSTGMHHGTASRVLKELAQVPGSCVRLQRRGRGLEADAYVIDLDQAVASHLENRSGPRAMVHALRPAFRVLGAAAALVYEALEEGHCGSAGQVARAAGLGASTTYRELHRLAEYGLVENTGRGWRLIRTRSLVRLAAELGMLDEVAAQLRTYQLDRLRWKELLSAQQAQHDRFLQEWELYDPEFQEDPFLRDLPPPDPHGDLPQLAGQSGELREIQQLQPDLAHGHQHVEADRGDQHPFAQ